LPYLAVVAAANDFESPSVFGEERQDVANHQESLGFRCRGDHSLAIGKPQSHGFFAEHVLAGLKRANGNIGMERSGQRDIDEFDLGVA
jgi:hypothetical protein